jgi:putative hydrolase of the HAD superfamily
MHSIKNIVFDLGGVLLDIDYQRSVDAFKYLGIEHFEKMFSQFQANELFEKLERGEINRSDFFDSIRKKVRPEVKDEEIEAAYNALILDFRIKSLEYLEELANNYNLYLLSNTNAIHVAFFKKLFTSQTGKPTLDGYFIKAWYSNEIGLRKPGAEIFKFILADEGLEAAETLFIDDTIDNIKTACELGFKTHLLLPHERIENLDLEGL